MIFPPSILRRESIHGARVDLWTASAISQAQAMAELWDSEYQLITVFEQRKYTQSRLAELTSNLVAGAGIVFLVVLVFMGWPPH